MISGNEVRRKFLEYFRKNGHTVMSSSSLVPRQDPTLLFTNAGMNQFKNYFTGEEPPPYLRAATSQKCVRAGGKHNDLENVGHTARHHTFFEMLGNFSFGDYFKEGAIALGWEFLTTVLGLPAEKLYATIHEGDSHLKIGPDEEARKLWGRYLPADRIRLFPTKDNFWQMGDTGPCGPCSEIIIDQGPSVGCGRPECALGCECDRFLELWNLVFMQFERHADGRMVPLPKPSIDTGMGLERVTAVVQGAKSNYDTDLFTPLLAALGKIAGRTYQAGRPEAVSFRVVADHIRAATFLIGDGVLPSNEGRGYVLRRIMRRAMRHGKKLGIQEPFLHRIVDEVNRLMGDSYPELLSSRDTVKMVIAGEEERFSDTLSVGLRLWSEEAPRLREKGGKAVPGNLIFKLYDTYGFPLDLTEELARDEGFALDRAGFEAAMEAQRARARESWKGSGDESPKEAYRSLTTQNLKTEFVGYDGLEAEGRVLKILKGDREVPSAGAGEEVEIITDRTPFYGESGGQEGDRGVLSGNGFRMEIFQCRKPLPDLTVHRGKIREGSLKTGDRLRLEVSPESRGQTALNHTATHLLQAALRAVLGEHVKQAGSLVSPARLRFDFTHFAPLTREEISRAEELVNAQIRRNLEVCIAHVPYREALEKGAMALFGEKYGETVRLVRVGEVSSELCGGTHARRSGDIGLFKIVSETGVAAGVRRIEALTGDGAWKALKEEEAELKSVAEAVKAKPGEVAEKVRRLLRQEKELEKKIRELEAKLAGSRTVDLLEAAKTVRGVRVLSARVEGKDPKGLREMADGLKDRLGSGILLLGTESEGKAMLLCAVTKDLLAKYSAQKLIQEIAESVGGKGGGRPDMAQAGGAQTEGLNSALEKIYDLV
jgi:alanyl-tRNA synthetase